jgi:hypothetical protein
MEIPQDSKSLYMDADMEVIRRIECSLHQIPMFRKSSAAHASNLFHTLSHPSAPPYQSHQIVDSLFNEEEGTGMEKQTEKALLPNRCYLVCR